MKRKLLATLTLLCCAAVILMAASPQQFILQVQNAGTTIGTWLGYAKLNCSTGMTCTASGSTVTMTASGGSGTVTSVTFTGDGTVLSSTPSSAVTTSGTVTASLAPNVATGTFLGNVSGSTGSPSFNSLATYLASPAAIGGTTPAAGAFTTLSMTSGSPLSWNGDTGCSRASALVIDCGSASQGTTTGTMQLANLTASATVRANTNFSASGTAGISGTTLCTATQTYTQGLITVCTASSDPLLKVFSRYRGGLDTIMAIEPIHFHWNEEGQRVNSIHDGEPNPEQIGFNARNLQTVLPEAVTKECFSTNPDPESKTIYDKVPCNHPHEKEYLALSNGDRPIVAALVNAIHQQQAEIELLKDQVAALKH
jgi:hypothetical protein